MTIFELHGVFAEPWIRKNKEEMELILEEHPSSGLLINLRELERIDHPGAETILEAARKSRKGGILGQNLSASLVAEHMQPNESIPIFQKESEAIKYFQRELAGGNVELERRQFPRVSTALPVALALKEDEEAFSFEAVLLNLSEGGLFARFLDSKTEELARKVLDPFDLKLLSIRLRLEEGKELGCEGKLLRTEDSGAERGGVAVEFYNLGNEARAAIRGFLKAKADT